MQRYRAAGDTPFHSFLTHFFKHCAELWYFLFPDRKDNWVDPLETKSSLLQPLMPGEIITTYFLDQCQTLQCEI